MTLCDFHKQQLPIIASIQKEAKRYRDGINRSPLPGEHGAYRNRGASKISRLNREIRWRRAALEQIQTGGFGCPWCRVLSSSHHEGYTFERLASSTGEQSPPGRKVVGSNPARAITLGKEVTGQ